MTGGTVTGGTVTGRAATAPAEALARRRPPRRSRLVTVTIAAALVALTSVVVAVAIGSTTLPIGDVVRALVGAADPVQEFIVLTFRLPRVVCALLVGACFGLAGALTQTFSRNPLATPDILGVTSGAAVGAVATIVIGGGGYAVGASLLGFGIPVVATVFGLVTAAVVYGLSWRGGVDSYRLILIGIGITATLTGATSYLLIQAQITQASAAAHWLAGSLSGISWVSVWPVLLVFVIVAPIAAAQSSALEVSGLGDDLSVGLGVALQRHRLIVIACAVVLTSAAVSASGPVNFVAFVAPQIAARLAARGRPPLAASALLGASLVVLADLLGRAAFPWEVPVGIVTAIVGAPYLIWLITRRRSRQESS